MRVFLGREVDEGRRQELATVIEGTPGVASYRYIDRSESLAEFEELFANDEEMLERAREDPLLVPTSFVVTPSSSDVLLFREIAEALAGEAGVLHVRTRVLGIDLPATGSVEVILFLQQGITEPDRVVVEQAVAAHPQTASYRYMDEAESVAEFERLFADNEAMLARARENPGIVPTSFRVVPRSNDPATVESMSAELGTLPGVIRAQSGVELTGSMQGALDLLGGC